MQGHLLLDHVIICCVFLAQAPPEPRTGDVVLPFSWRSYKLLSDQLRRQRGAQIGDGTKFLQSPNSQRGRMLP